jgi:dsDNA-specific endonuclease/ATPase MutS2
MTGDDEIPDDVVLPIEDALDLHAFAPRDVKDVVASYLEAALESGLREVRIIHGRGIGFQREAVREILAHHPRVASFADAPPDRGGWGATVVRFKAESGPAG